MQYPVIFLLLSLFLKSVLSCRCRPKTLQEAFDSSLTVLDGVVLSKGPGAIPPPFPPGCRGNACRIHTESPSTIYKVKLLKVLKGCSPSSNVFLLDAYFHSCFTSFTVGSRHVFTLDKKEEVRETAFGKKAYDVHQCQKNPYSPNLSVTEKKLLHQLSKKDSSKCKKTAEM